MGTRFGAFHRTKYIKSHDNMAQIILPSKIKHVGTSNEIQNHQKDIAQTKIAHCVGTSNEIQYHPFYFWGQLLSSLFGTSLVAVRESGGTGRARGWKREAKRRRTLREMGVDTASFPFFHYAFLRFSFRVIH